MTPSPNYANAGRRVLAAAVVVSMSVPLSISAAMAAPEEQASIAEVTESVQKTDRETSTIDLGASTQEAVTEPQTASAAAVEKAEQSETSETESASPEVQQSSVEAAAENTQVEVAPEGVREEVEQPPQQQAQDQYQNARSSSHSTRHIDKEELEQAPVEADSERRFESTEQLDARAQPKAAHEKEDDPEDADLNSHEDEFVDDKAPSLEDETEEEDYEEESEETPNFSPNGPSLDFRGVRPEADYIIRVGDSERIYTTDPEGSAAIKVLEDFDLSPGAHKVAIVGPDGQEQEITFYATEMQADKTQVNVVGLDPSATYQLSLDGRIAHVGVIDFASLPDGTFTIDINKQFPHAWPGKHVVTLTGGGYNQTAYVRIPLMPTNPDPEPDPDPAPNPQPEPGPDPVPGPHPEPIPNPGLYPSPEPNPGTGENQLPFPKTHPPQSEVDESAASNDEEEAMPSAIESLNIFHAAEAVEANRPPAYEAAELPLAAGDQANHAAPDALRGTNRHEHRLEAAPMPHAPAPLEQHRNEIQSPRHEPVEQDRFQPDSHNVENTAQGPDSLDTERASMSGLSVAAWIGAALAILAALGVVVFGRKRGTE